MKNILFIILFVFMSSVCQAETLAQKNNNPVNLKAFVKWDGMTGKDKFGHAIFTSLDYGIRAALKNALTRQRLRPDQTLREWMNDFAEENGDNEANYIASKLDVSRETKLRDIDMSDLIIHQAWFEGRIKITEQKINQIKERFFNG